MSLVTFEVPIKNGTLQNPQQNEEEDIIKQICNAKHNKKQYTKRYYLLFQSKVGQAPLQAPEKEAEPHSMRKNGPLGSPPPTANSQKR